MEDQFVVPERRGTPDDPITYPGWWRGLMLSPPAQIGETRDQSMGNEVVIPPTPLDKEVQHRDDERQMVVSIDKTRPPAKHVTTPVQHDEDISCQMLKFLFKMTDRSERRSPTPGFLARPTTSILPGCGAGSL